MYTINQNILSELPTGLEVEVQGVVEYVLNREIELGNIANIKVIGDGPFKVTKFSNGFTVTKNGKLYFMPESESASEAESIAVASALNAYTRQQ